MERFVAWYYRNRVEIIWFLIGYLTMAGLNEFNRANYTGALIDWGLAYLNYFLHRR
jgi:uncharacterized protein (DUF486 family)